jgi:hypothetical protein
MVDARRRRAATAAQESPGELPESNIRAIAAAERSGTRPAAGETLNLQAPKIPRPPRLPLLPEERNGATPIDAPQPRGRELSFSPLAVLAVAVVVAGAVGFGTWRLLHRQPLAISAGEASGTSNGGPPPSALRR